jgi:ATP-dependent Clp protease adaptor protein ClpS
MNFVMFVLNKFFNKNPSEAERLMLEVHDKGCGVAGVYAKEQAELRALETMKLARINSYPLHLSIEED